jgi:D-glycero-D-manno-heptose 1,7-bisphosphate phosphatase
VTKLIVFDKDGTLTQPISGNTFVQHPEDQQLRPGVAQKLEQLRAEGWTMAIASNQGGCAVFEIAAADLKPGMRLRDDLYPDGFEILSVKPAGEESTQVEFDSEGLPVVTLEPNNRMFEVFYKSTRMAIAEMKFALKLTGMEAAFFCPDMDGEKLWAVIEQEIASEVTGLYKRCGSFRKPDPGMLRAVAQWACFDDALMVGDRPEDQAAALAAGFDFCWADDFFGGEHE